MSTASVNPNTQWIESTSGWAAYLLFVVAVRIFGSLAPTYELAWTITIVAHNVITLVLFHFAKGMPFEGQVDNYGQYSKLTFWEQLDNGQQYSPTRKLLMAVPIILFLIGSFVVELNGISFMLAFASLVAVMVAKFPVMHKKRLFGLNKD